jgi:hypothetical protein
MTLGPAILLLWWFDSRFGADGARSLLRRFRNVFVTFGRVPLFFYLLQWYTSHLIAVGLGFIAGQPVAYQFLSPLDKLRRVTSLRVLGFVSGLCTCVGLAACFCSIRCASGLPASKPGDATGGYRTCNRINCCCFAARKNRNEKLPACSFLSVTDIGGRGVFRIRRPTSRRLRSATPRRSQVHRKPAPRP